MSSHGLNRQQMDNLKCAYLCETRDNPTWEELAAADSIVSDETIHHYYDGVVFAPEDLNY